MEKLMLLIAMFMFMLRSSHSQCSNSTTGFRTNLRTLLDSLTKNAPLHDGFYQAYVGNPPDRAFGTLHCKANISRNACANCLRAPMLEMDDCPENTETLTTSCTMQLSNKNFSGVWSNTTIYTFEASGLDDPSVFSKGFAMMEELAGTVPGKPLMYEIAEVDVGVNEKRYGLAQCGRDLSKVSCQNCLEARLDACRSFVQNRSGWEVFGVGCSMWYSSFRNISVPDIPSTSSSRLPPNVISGVQRCHGGIGVTATISIAISIAAFTILLGVSN